MAPPEESAAPRRLRRVFSRVLAIAIVLSVLAMVFRSTTLDVGLSNVQAFWQVTRNKSSSSLRANPSSSVADTATEETLSDRGVILCVHDGILAMAASLIRELRCLGNHEVIQVYYCFPDDLSADSRALLASHDSNIEFVDVCADLLYDREWFFDDEAHAKRFRNYWIKPLAVCHTRLSHVIMLDADDILLRNPADLRSLSGYTRTGTVFFHDRITFMRSFFNSKLEDGQQMLKHILDTFDYAAFGIENHTYSNFLTQSFAFREETGHEMDSSMVLIDKTRAGKALEVLKHLILTLRFQYAFSWGDKESFWIAYELAQQPYFFSPYGLSLVDSVPNGDMQEHPETLCGSMAHFLPTEDRAAQPELLYVNGKALLDPFPLGVEKTIIARKSRMYNLHPTHVTPRYLYAAFDLSTRAGFECLNKLGSVELPQNFHARLLRRRYHYFAAAMGAYDALDRCDI